MSEQEVIIYIPHSRLSSEFPDDRPQADQIITKVVNSEYSSRESEISDKEAYGPELEAVREVLKAAGIRHKGDVTLKTVNSDKIQGLNLSDQAMQWLRQNKTVMRIGDRYSILEKKRGRDN